MAFGEPKWARRRHAGLNFSTQKPDEDGKSAMPIKLAALTALFPGGEWRQALAAPIRQSQLEQDLAGRRLHDDTGQNLSALGLQLSVLLLDFEDGAIGLTGRVREIQDRLENTMARVREISAVLNPSAVDRSGLRFALEDLAHSRGSEFVGGVRLEFPAGIQVERSAARALFRVAGPSLDLAASTGATTIVLKIIEGAFGWILEVLYDVSSPPYVDELKAVVRLNLLLLEYQAMRAGVDIVLDDSPGGGSLIRAAYTAGDEPR